MNDSVGIGAFGVEYTDLLPLKRIQAFPEFSMITKGEGGLLIGEAIDMLSEPDERTPIANTPPS